MKKLIATSLTITLLFAVPVLANADQDARQKIKLPEMMKHHMLGNMRDHMQAISEIEEAIAKGKTDQAADIAEQRLGMSSLEEHHAAQMAKFMPQTMQDIGTEMHHAASRFAMTVKEGDTLKSLDGLAKVTQQCVACHAAYRLN
jgi:hypothetical protein